MTAIEVQHAMQAASSSVLETMFFSEPVPAEAASAQHANPVACLLHCSGAEEGVFSVAVDLEALRQLGCAFYGQDALDLTQEQELICELTNMLAGSTLSAIAPSRYCELSSPQLCSFERHTHTASSGEHDLRVAPLYLQLDGGLLSVSCSLRPAA
jgi:CheY-specific phosphatase CheX